MPKRSRGTGRPGQRPPMQRGARPASPGSAKRSTGPRTSDVVGTGTSSLPPAAPRSLTAEEEARAAQLEAQILAEERAAEVAQRRTRDRARAAELAGLRTREAAPLAVRAANEYAYVRRDINRIARVGGLLLAVLLLLHVAINVLGLIRV